MKRSTLIAVIVAAVVGIGFNTLAEEKKAEPKKQTNCPVMGGKIDKAQYVDVKGYRIYTCCPGCIGKIKADPDKYIKQLEDQGIVLDKTPMKKDAKKPEAGHEGHQH